MTFQPCNGEESLSLFQKFGAHKPCMAQKDSASALSESQLPLTLVPGAQHLGWVGLHTRPCSKRLSSFSFQPPGLASSPRCLLPHKVPGPSSRFTSFRSLCSCSFWLLARAPNWPCQRLWRLLLWTLIPRGPFHPHCSQGWVFWLDIWT